MKSGESLTWSCATSLLVYAMMATSHVVSSSRRMLSNDNNFNSGLNKTGNKSVVTIKLAVILPFSGDYAWSLPRIKPAIMLAVDDVVSTPNSASGSSLEFHIDYGNSKCSETMGPLAAIDKYFERRADVFIGPACDYAVSPVARFSPHWNIPVVTAGALVSAFGLKSTYRLLTRVTSPYSELGVFMVHLLAEFNWTTPGIVYQNHLGVRSMKVGKSRCYFTVEGVYTAFQKSRSADSTSGVADAGSRREIWRRPFDPDAPDGFNATEILREVQTKARST